jgi:hypothetical protein
VAVVIVPATLVGYPAPMYAMVRAAILGATATVAAGCLSTAHRVPGHELQALAQTPPEQRGERVRVIQGFASEEQPPEAPRVHGGAQVVVVAHGGGGSRRRGPPARRSAASRSDDARFWLIAAVAVAAGLAVTEGARYDGWVRVHPMHPVHMYGPMGEYTWVPLAQITPETAAWARKAFVRETEGPWERLGRAPLDRAGWTYSVLLGAAQIPSAAERAASGGDATGEPGFMGHIQIGRYLSQEFGMVLDFGLGYRTNDFGKTVFEARNALELQVMPLSAGRIHGGAYGQIGVGVRVEDGARGEDRRAFQFGGGALLQLEITTRLAITGRAGLTYIFGEATREAGIGVSIY